MFKIMRERNGIFIRKKATSFEVALLGFLRNFFVICVWIDGLCIFCESYFVEHLKKYTPNV